MTELRRYPLAPLLALMGEPSADKVCKSLGISGSTQKDYRTRGVTERVADRLAARLGLVAYEVWPEMLDHAIEDASKPCAHCGDLFIPARSTSTCCSRGCSLAAAQKRYRTSPKGRETHRLTRRRQYAEYGDYERARQRRYDLARRTTRSTAA